MILPARLNPLPVDERYSGIYSHGIATGKPRTIFVSGQVGIATDGSLPPDFGRQCTNAIERVVEVVRGGGLQRRDIVKMGFYLVNRSDMTELVRIRQTLLGGIGPAVTTVIVAGLVEPEWLVEIEAIAVESARAESQSVQFTDRGF